MMTHRRIYTFLLSGLLIAGCAQAYQLAHKSDSAAANKLTGLEHLEPAAGPLVPSHNFVGAYLASQFAQKRNDWATASQLLNRILESDPDNQELVRQAMILAAGAGHFEQAALHAEHLRTLDPDDSLAGLISAARALQTEDYVGTLNKLDSIPAGDMNDFVIPLLRGWAMAGQQQFDPEMMSGSTIHAWHGGLIAYHLKKPAAQINQFAEIILSPSGLTSEEVERAADLMALADRKKDALNLYKALKSQQGDNSSPIFERIENKIAAMDQDGDIMPLLTPANIKVPAHGAALAIFDLARILYIEESDPSARVFAQIALGMKPDLVDARILLASSYARGDNIDEAIAQYLSIPQDNVAFLGARHTAATLLAEHDRMDDAIDLLNQLYREFKDPDSLIRLGDLYRGEEDYAKALTIYDQVLATLPTPVPDHYWYLTYARGMTLERLGKWDKAEIDLKAALKAKPQNPYIMNYLAYGWADQGIHLEKAVDMLERASALKPQDGYITDSLGWVYYRIGNYNRAIPHLERAVELLPYDPTINDHLGDAYWKVGRKIEARFQWERARSNAKEQNLIDTINHKLAHGLTDTPHNPVREAHTQQ